jgi:hypothetical protein
MTPDEAAMELWAIAARIPCELCSSKGSDQVLPDGGCRHRPSKGYALATVLEAVLRIRRVLGLPIEVVCKEPLRARGGQR